MEFEKTYKTVDHMAKLLGKPKEVIIKMIQHHELTAVKDENGEWIIPVYYSKGIRYVNSERDQER